MKKILFCIILSLFLNYTLASESESGILHFSVDEEGLFFSEQSNKHISINVENFNRYMKVGVTTVDRVYNTRKTGKDVISFSVDAGEVQYHNIRCQIVYGALPFQESINHRLYFYDCGNNEIRFEESPIDMRYEWVSAGGGIVPN